MGSVRFSAGSTGAVMRFPCGHSEPEASAAERVRVADLRAVWIACPKCNLIALACAPAGRRRRGVRRNLTARAH